MPKMEKEPLFHEMHMKMRKQRVPFSGIFELTPRCTLDCKMCYVHLTESQMNGKKELSGDQWIKIMDDAIENGMAFALLTGGECLLHKDFKKIYLHLREKGIMITLNTNGTVMNDELIDFFVKNPPNRIKVTLYGASEEGYERVTGHRQFARVRDNILKLKNAGFYVTISVTICKYNYDETLDIIKFARENGLKYNVDMAMFQANENTGRDLNDYDLSGEQVAEKYREIAIMTGQKLYDNEPITELPQRMDNAKVATRLRCGAGRSTFSVSWDGKMYPCLWVQDEPQNLFEKSFVECWKECNRIVEEYILPVECSTCEYFNACALCTIKRADPNDRGHCNPAVCAGAIAKINAGVGRKKSQVAELDTVKD